jgi:hypothetical protein
MARTYEGAIQMTKEELATLKPGDKILVSEKLRYEPDTGIFIWMVSSGKARVGAKAGSISANGYLKIGVGGKEYYAHRLAWFMVFGEWPNGEIDHRDGDRTNNRIINLRDSSRAENAQNVRAAHSDSKSGLLGVSWSQMRQKWHSQIMLRGQKIDIGFFDTANDAHTAYLNKKRQIHKTCTI